MPWSGALSRDTRVEFIPNRRSQIQCSTGEEVGESEICVGIKKQFAFRYYASAKEVSVARLLHTASGPRSSNSDNLQADIRTRPMQPDQRRNRAWDSIAEMAGQRR